MEEKENSPIRLMIHRHHVTFLHHPMLLGQIFLCEGLAKIPRQQTGYHYSKIQEE